MIDPALDEDALWAELPNLQDEDLPSVLSHPSANERHILKLLMRPSLPAEFLAMVGKCKWANTLRMQSALAMHPNTPVAEAMNLVKFLFWRDLNLVILNFRIAAEVRHAAESMLIQRLPSMAVGEKMTLARITGGQIIKALRLEKDSRVVKALLENPRLVEEDVLFLASQPRVPAPVLEAVAQDPRWSSRKEVRTALLRNSHTPLALTLSFINSLTAHDLRTLVADMKVPLAVRKAIQRKLGGP